MMQLDEYLEYVKRVRKRNFPTPYEVTYECFKDLGYTEQTPEFFMEHASDVVEMLRKNCWERFLQLEREFTKNRLIDLIDVDIVRQMDPVDAISSFATEYTEHFYQLCLSNTQSRRSRAGKEFEAIIELILMGAEVPMDAQGGIGKQIFVNKGLSKLVDVVSPGVVEFEIDKNDTVLITAKTTLRERWQEVPEEMSRTGASLMFLATLDENISSEVQETLYESNIRITTTKENKRVNYDNNRRILSFEELLRLCAQKRDSWEEHQYSETEYHDRVVSIEKQKERHAEQAFVIRYYNNWLRKVQGQRTV